MDIRGGFKSKHNLTHGLLQSEKIKSLRSYSMCRKPFIPAVSPIFCSSHLYQISEFYFSKMPDIGKTVLSCVVLQNPLLVLNAYGFPGSLIVISAEAAAYPKLLKIYKELNRQNGIIFDAERERNGLELERDSLKGLAKLTKKGELQSRIDRKNYFNIIKLLENQYFPDIMN